MEYFKEAIDATELDGFGVVAIPPELFAREVRQFADRIVRDVYAMRPATNPTMRAVYRMLSRLADQRITTTMEAVTVGLLMAAAKRAGDALPTPTRDIAKELGVRYAILLKVRAAGVWALDAECV